MAILTFQSGMKLFAARHYEALYSQSIQALRQNEKNPLAFFFIGLIASEQGDLNKAAELFAKASELENTNARYPAYQAKTLMALGHRGAAKKCADIAAKLNIDDAFVADMIGTVYSRAGDHNLALPLFERAVKLNPKWALFQFNLGASAQFVGDFEKAKTAYENTVALNPGFAQAWYALVSLATQTHNNNHLETLKPLFEKAHQDVDAQLILGHAIAKTLEDLGRYPESLDWLVRAKAPKKTLIKYDRQAQTKIFQAAKTWAYPNADIPEISASETPIFIVGMPRTGTTLLDRILSAHKDVRSAGELNMLGGLVNSANMNGANQTQDLMKVGQTFYQHISDVNRHHPDGKRRFIIDKTPLNFFNVGLINQMFPNARIIALRRGAMDSCLSNYRHVFAQYIHDFDYTFDLLDTAWIYRKYDELMAHFCEHLPGNRFMEIHYEQMITDQENQTRRLLDFCDLPWDPACMRFHKNAAPVDTASSVQVRAPLHTGSIGRWKKYGDGLDDLKNALGDLAD